MANIKDRAGSVYIRVGGNTQESASLVDSLPNNAILSKDGANTNNIVNTWIIVLVIIDFLFFFQCISDQDATGCFHWGLDIHDGKHLFVSGRQMAHGCVIPYFNKIRSYNVGWIDRHSFQRYLQLASSDCREGTANPWRLPRWPTSRQHTRSLP